MYPIGKGSTRFLFQEVAAKGTVSPLRRGVAREVPVAIELNGFGYAVLMATPDYLEDLAYGFALSERLIESSEQIDYVLVHEAERGIILRIGLIASLASRIHDRVRHRISDSSCGLCGLENLEQAMRPLARLADSEPPDHRAVFAALDALRDRQFLNRETGGVHAAALCDQDGGVTLVREDVGRHNAFDKLIGAMMRLGLAWSEGFALLTSRCSYELVEKAVLSSCPLLVTISVPTSLALTRAAEANLRLYVLARSDSMLCPEANSGEFVLVDVS